MITRLVRTNRGTKIHRADCGQLSRCKKHKPMPWNWADDKNEAIIASAVVQFGYQLCAYCNPVRIKAAWR